MPEGVGYGPQYTASTGLTLNYIGNHAYAYSGSITANTGGIVALLFDSGKEYHVGSFSFSGMFDENEPSIGLRGTCIIEFNGNVALTSLGDQDNGNMVSPSLMPAIIPPFTTVKVTVYANSTSTTYDATVGWTGRIYK